MREIEFRAWHNDIMWYNTNNHSVWVGPIAANITGLTENNTESFSYIIELDCVMQYTGLEDVNAVKIYEGDIVDDGFNNKGVIEYDEHSAMFGYYRKENFGRHWYSLIRMSPDKEVIGNVHQNKELLEAK
jgi:uncharacterized phage protein (TIGR01671 family)